MGYTKVKIIILSLFLCLALISGCGTNPDSGPEDTSADKTENSSASVLPETVKADEEDEPVTDAKNDPALAALRESLGNSDSILGIAFLGYADSEGSDDTIRYFVQNGQYSELYPFLCDGTLVRYEGSELFALVPANDESSITICKTVMSNDGEYVDNPDDIIYSGKPGETILLRCNTDEFISNVFIYINGKEDYKFHPVFSPTDGFIIIEDHCYDFTLYTYENDEDIAIGNAYGVLMENDEISYYTGLGMTLFYIGEHQTIEGSDCLIFALGTLQDEQFIQEYLYAVSDTVIYYLDAETNEWHILGAG